MRGKEVAPLVGPAFILIVNRLIGSLDAGCFIVVVGTVDTSFNGAEGLGLSSAVVVTV